MKQARDRESKIRACKACGKPFRAKREWQTQCSPRCRQRAYARRLAFVTLNYYGA